MAAPISVVYRLVGVMKAIAFQTVQRLLVKAYIIDFVLLIDYREPNTVIQFYE